MSRRESRDENMNSKRMSLCSTGRTMALLAGSLLLTAQHARAAIREEVVHVPVSVTTMTGQAVSQNIIVTIWRDDSRESAPFLVLNHGRPANAPTSSVQRYRYTDNSRYFVSKGFVVFVPTRAGYGPSGGIDVEYSGPCRARNFTPAYRAAADQTRAVMEHAKTLPYVDRTRGLVVGQSFGGATAIAVAAMNPSGVVAAVNFAGGGGGNPESSPDNPCSPERMQRMLAGYAKTARIPTLWLYSENDRYWGPVLPKQWFSAFVDAGGKGTFVSLPPNGTNGHGIFTANPVAWKPAFEDFLKKVGF
jgi:dienelactone hydrolase